MDDNSRDRLTLARRFLEPANATHRQYEAIQVFFVEGVPSAEVVTQLGYTPGSFRVLLHEFRNQPERDVGQRRRSCDVTTSKVVAPFESG